MAVNQPVRLTWNSSWRRTHPYFLGNGGLTLIPMAEWTLIHFLCPKLGEWDGLRVGPWHWKLSKCPDTRGRENTAVFRGAIARRCSAGADLYGDCFSRALLQTCFGIRRSNWRSSWLRSRPWRGREEAVDTAVQGTALEMRPETGWPGLYLAWGKLGNELGFVRWWYAITEWPTMWSLQSWFKHTTPAICCSVSQGNSLLTIRARPVTKADKVCSLAAGRPVRCARWPSLRTVCWAKPARSFLLYSITAIPFPRNEQMTSDWWVKCLILTFWKIP